MPWVTTVLDITGGLAESWFFTAFDPVDFFSGGTALISGLYLVLFTLLAIVLLLYYISRLITIAIGAVLAPLIFLLWSLPATADFAKAAIKPYLVTIFIVFIHIVTILLASAFLFVTKDTLNQLLSLLLGIGIFFTLLKIPGMLAQMALYSSMSGDMRTVGSQVINVMSVKKA